MSVATTRSSTHGGADGPPHYRPEIDGLRALAVTLVVLFHARASFFGAGFIGVDVFFVISGYLITGVLHREALEGCYDIVEFYERRVRRIVPALFVALGAVFAIGWFVLLPDELTELARQLIAATLFASNLLLWQTSGYFDAEATTRPLQHAWSLAVEEQFYILFPLGLWLLVRWLPKWLLPVIVATAALSLALSAWALAAHPTATFYLLPTRAWELLAGSALALVPSYRGRWAGAISGAGLCAIVISATAYHEGMAFPGLAALPPCLGAAAVLHAAEHSRVGDALALRPLRAVGFISYSLYLWHWPLLVYARFVFGDPLPQPLALAAVAASMVFATLSWRFVEQPVRKRASASTVWRIGAAAVAAGLLVPAATLALDGVPRRFPASGTRALSDARRQFGELGAAYACATPLLDGVANFGPCRIGVDRKSVDLLVIGDSHAMAIRGALDRSSAELGLSGSLIAVPGCAPLLGFDRVGYETPCAKRQASAFRFASNERPRAVVLVASMRKFLETIDSEFEGRLGNESASRSQNVRRALVHTVGEYRRIGAAVGIILQVPGARTDVPHTLARGFAGLAAYSAAEASAAAAPLRTAVQAARPDVIGDFARPLCGKTCAVAMDGKPIYLDRSHLSALGVKLVEPEVKRVLAALIGKEWPR